MHTEGFWAMTYITGAQLSSAMGATSYAHTMAVDGGTTADATLVSDLLARVDAIIDKYNTQLSSAEKATIAYPIAIYQAYFRRGPGNVPFNVQQDYTEAIAELKTFAGIRVRPCYVPEDKLTQDDLDDMIEEV